MGRLIDFVDESVARFERSIPDCLNHGDNLRRVWELLCYRAAAKTGFSLNVDCEKIARGSSKKTSRRKIDRPKTSDDHKGMRRFEVPGKFAKMTDKAIGIINDGEWLWLPISQLDFDELDKLHVNRDVGSLWMQKWLGKKHGFKVSS